MSKILLMTSDFPPRRGGVARYLNALAKYFREDILVVAEPEIGASNFDNEAGYKIIREKLLYKNFWPQWIKAVFIFWKLRSKYDIAMVSHILPLGTAQYVASFITKKPYMVILHGMDIALAKRNKMKEFLAKKILEKAKLVIVNSEALKNEVATDFAIDQIEVIYPVIDFEPNEVAKINDNRLRLLTVSRLVERKGHLRVLEALAILRQTNQIDGIEYAIVGLGPMDESIRSRMRALALENIVDIKTNVSDEQLKREYSHADVFIMPTVAGSSDREGFGMVYLEAAQHGTPSVATNHPGVNEAVIHNETGLLVKDGDIEELAYAITKFRNHEFKNRLGNNARNRVQDFSAETQFSKLDKYL